MSAFASPEELVYSVPKSWADRAHLNGSTYRDMYALSVSAPDRFWASQGKRIDWFKPYTTVKNTCFDPGKVLIKWFEDGTTNVSMNCIDRHLATRADQIAIIWEGDDPNESKLITYRELHGHVCRLANMLKSHGVSKGDTVTIYPSNDSRGRILNAGLCANRRHTLRRVRWLFAGCARRANRGLRLEGRHHGRRRSARRAQSTVESQCRRRCCEGAERRSDDDSGQTYRR
jgi:Acetyl-coenzyme A synthetase N-terminus/AMP-binding enzyme